MQKPLKFSPTPLISPLHPIPRKSCKLSSKCIQNPSISHHFHCYHPGLCYGHLQLDYWNSFLLGCPASPLSLHFNPNLAAHISFQLQNSHGFHFTQSLQKCGYLGSLPCSHPSTDTWSSMLFLEHDRHVPPYVSLCKGGSFHLDTLLPGIHLVLVIPSSIIYT